MRKRDNYLFSVIPRIFVSCGPNEVLVVSRCLQRKPRYVAGGTVFVWPIFQCVNSLPLNLMTLQVESPKVYTSLGVPISVTGIAQIKIQGQNEEMLSTACEMFLGKSEFEIANIVLSTLEGHQRAIMGTMTVEEIYQDRKKFSSQVFEVASSDLVNMGITIVSYTLKDINDDEGYLTSLGMTRTAEVKRDARIGEAMAMRDAKIREAEAEMERMASRLLNDTEIARAKRDYELKKAEYEAESLKKKAEAEMAFDLQIAKVNQKLMEEKMNINIIEREQEITLENQEILRKMQVLEANIKAPAAAEKYRLDQMAEANQKKIILEAEGEAQAIRERGEAEAYAIEMLGKADSEQMQNKAKALDLYKDAAILDMILEAMPKIASEISTPLAQTKKITMVSNGAGNVGPSKLTEEIFLILSKIPDIIKVLTGVDVVNTIHNSM